MLITLKFLYYFHLLFKDCFCTDDLKIYLISSKYYYNVALSLHLIVILSIISMLLKKLAPSCICVFQHDYFFALVYSDHIGIKFI